MFPDSLVTLAKTVDLDYPEPTQEESPPAPPKSKVKRLLEKYKVPKKGHSPLGHQSVPRWVMVKSHFECIWVKY